MMEIDAVVTGGAGFVGSHLCESLLTRGQSVLCLDNLSTGRFDNIAALQVHPRFQFVHCDVTHPFTKRVAPRFIYHLASPASVPDYLGRPLQTVAANSVGTMRMLELARTSDARFLFTSTSEIYGDPLVHPQVEEYWGNVNPVGVRACYDESKRFGEMVTREYVRSLSVDARIVRIFNTYGPRSRSDDGRIVPNFITQALRGEPLTVHGDGTQTRSYCYVTDLVAGLVTAMETPGMDGEVFNLGNPDEYTVLEMAETISACIGSRAGIVYRPLPEDDPTRRRPNIDKACERLGWAPTVQLPIGITRTVAWFQSKIVAEATA